MRGQAACGRYLHRGDVLRAMYCVAAELETGQHQMTETTYRGDEDAVSASDSDHGAGDELIGDVEDLDFDPDNLPAEELEDPELDDPELDNLDGPDLDDHAESGEDIEAPLAGRAPDEDSEDVLSRVVEGDEDEDLDLREGEFVCRSCYLVKRPSQLADPGEQLCVDCV